MKLQDLIPKVEGVHIAVVKDGDGTGVDWHVYIINQKNEPINDILIQATGKGEIDAWPVKTSTLRHFIEKIEANSYAKVEAVIEEVFGLENNYWVSFYIGRSIYDRKFVFPPNSITGSKCINIPLIDKQGVLAV